MIHRGQEVNIVITLGQRRQAKQIIKEKVKSRVNDTQAKEILKRKRRKLFEQLFISPKMIKFGS